MFRLISPLFLLFLTACTHTPDRSWTEFDAYFEQKHWDNDQKRLRACASGANPLAKNDDWKSRPCLLAG